MRAGYTLYQQIFYSQPPFFMYSTYPFYILFGGTLWSARFGIALVSLLGLAGAYLMGKSIGGRFWGIPAVVFLGLEPPLLCPSQKNLEGVFSVAFFFPAVGAACLLWEMSQGAGGPFFSE